MESLDELSKISNGKPGFFKHVFNFNEESKSEMSNIIQYTVLALIPIIILNKSMQKWVPEADDEKGSLELGMEIIVQVIAMFMGILLVHRMITFIPTYSGEKYSDFSVVNIVLSVLLIVLSLQTKLGEKVSILVDRINELWEGKSNQKNKKNTNVKVSQPISQGQQQQPQQQYQMTNTSSMGTTSISALPPVQSMPDYNQMYQTDNTPLVGAATPGMESFEPMAANGGGGAFASAFGSGW
jgi:hypothetical protein